MYLFLGVFTYGQVGIGINTPPHPSAILDIESDNKGLLIPRLTTAERGSIVTPSEGLMIYNTTTKCLEVNTVTETVPVWKCTSDSSTTTGGSGFNNSDWETGLTFTDLLYYNSFLGFNTYRGLALSNNQLYAWRYDGDKMLKSFGTGGCCKFFFKFRSPMRLNHSAIDNKIKDAKVLGSTIFILTTDDKLYYAGSSTSFGGDLQVAVGNTIFFTETDPVEVTLPGGVTLITEFEIGRRHLYLLIDEGRLYWRGSVLDDSGTSTSGEFAFPSDVLADFKYVKILGSLEALFACLFLRGSDGKNYVVSNLRSIFLPILSSINNLS